MFLKFVLIFVVIQYVILTEYIDTDCYKEAGSSVDECRKFTTFVPIDETGFAVEENVLYLCCYVDDTLNSHNYKGCHPVKEDTYFNNEKTFNYQCSSFFIKIKQILMIIGLFIIFL